jgi:hypothetical protein
MCMSFITIARPSLTTAGFYYEQKSARVVRAVPCPENTYSPGLDKAIKCKGCPNGFKTDPESVAGTATSIKACREWHYA